MIILSVTYLGFHLNYRWILVTSSVASGTAIFLVMLFILIRTYNFEAVVACPGSLRSVA
jgi:hypothetical protein